MLLCNPEKTNSEPFSGQRISVSVDMKNPCSPIAAILSSNSRFTESRIDVWVSRQHSVRMRFFAAVETNIEAIVWLLADPRPPNTPL